MSTDLLVVTPRGSRLLDETAAPVAPASSAADTADVSVSGILMAQQAVVCGLPAAGVDVLGSAAPAKVIGHSQGVLGVALLRALREADGDVTASFRDWRSHSTTDTRRRLR